MTIRSRAYRCKGGKWGLTVASLLSISLSCRSREATAPPVEEDSPPDPVVSEVLEQAAHPWLRWPVLTDVAAPLRALYHAEGDGLVWFDKGRPVPALPESIRVLSGVSDHALSPTDYDARRIEEEWTREQSGALESRDRALFDLAVSVGLLRVIQAVHTGRVDPRTLGWGFDVTPKKLDRAALLRGARDGGGVPALLEALEPPFPHYARNREMLARYRRLAEQGEPEPVPVLTKDRRKIEPGDSWEGVPQLRARLERFGDLTTPTDSLRYEGPLVEAVRRFQTRHLLDADGVIGNDTIEALNRPIAARVRQIELAMERGRWLPRLDERPLVFVNVPLFRLWASDPIRGDEPLRMKVVVGKSLNHATPIFAEQMEYVVFRPYWSPTPSILRNEILPQVKRNPAYLDKEDLEIVASGDDHAEALPASAENLEAVAKGRLFLRQRPGPRNSLGLVKFIFPNRENIYMHGTPAPHLFARTRRDFSHGCIRLENPAALAEWVLRDVPGWSRERIEGAMQGDRPLQVNLKDPLRVVIFYDTVHVNSEMVVHFVSDIYGHDQQLDAALAHGYPYPEPAADRPTS